MKQLLQPEPSVHPFEGATAEEAVRLARRELGADALVRCWRVRRGGLLGFFAQERYVAGLEPPAGAVDPLEADRLPRAPGHAPSIGGPTVTHRSERPAPPGGVTPGPDLPSTSPPPPPAPPPASSGPAFWAELVEETTDEVVLGSRMSERAFSDVLAEAEAAVSTASGMAGGGAALSADPRPPEPAPPEPRPTGPGPAGATHPVEGLGRTLVELGVPAAYRPGGGDPGLDALVRSLGGLPVAPPLPTRPGSVIVVAGPLRDARAIGEGVRTALGLPAADLVLSERTDAGRQRILRRRSRKSTTVVVVEAPLGSRCMATVGPWVERIRPDHRLGVVPATAKPSDVVQWCRQFGTIDALAVSCLADTATPGELMGVLPISHLDGSDASALRWAWLLLGRHLERPE